MKMAAIFGAMVGLGSLAPGWSHAASITVSTTDDELNSDGDCSLREAVQAANTDTAVDACDAGAGTDLITLPAGTYVLSQSGASEDNNATGDLDIVSHLTIEGASADTTIIDGMAADRVFDVAATKVVTLRSLTVRNGHAADGTTEGQPGEHGGGIRNLGDLTLEDCVIAGNRAGSGGASMSSTAAGGGGEGGGLYNTGTLDVLDCVIADNQAGNGGTGSSTSGNGGDGGGISNHGIATVAGSTIENNFAGSGGGLFTGSPSLGYGGHGGGMATQSAMVIESTTVRNNQAGDGRYLAHGGGLYKNGAGAFYIRDSLFADNHTGADFDDPGALGHGGGVYAYGAGNITNSTFTGNTGALGSAVIAMQGTTKVSHSTIVDNFASISSGGAIWGYVRIRGTIIADNLGGDCASSFDSTAGYNLLNVGSACPTTTGDRTITAGTLFSDVLDDLEDNGGSTLTYALKPGSLAIDTGICTDQDGAEVATDQRGASRPSGNDCDIGAFEDGNLPTPEYLIVTTDEPPGENCAYGGRRIDGGLDNGDGAGTARDGVLHPDEIDSTMYICDDTSDGLVLIVVSAEPVDAACPAGGTRIMAGQDDNEDGVLQPEEIDTESVVCNGVDSADSRILVSDIAPGNANCTNGGQRVDIGLDINGNGVLDADEVESTSYICQPAARGGCNAGGGTPGSLVMLLGLLFLVRWRGRAW